MQCNARFALNHNGSTRHRDCKVAISLGQEQIATFQIYQEENSHLFDISQAKSRHNLWKYDAKCNITDLVFQVRTCLKYSTYYKIDSYFNYT